MHLKTTGFFGSPPASMCFCWANFRGSKNQPMPVSTAFLCVSIWRLGGQQLLKNSVMTSTYPLFQKVDFSLKTKKRSCHVCQPCFFSSVIFLLYRFHQHISLFHQDCNSRNTTQPANHWPTLAMQAYVRHASLVKLQFTQITNPPKRHICGKHH